MGPLALHGNEALLPLPGLQGFENFLDILLRFIMAIKVLDQKEFSGAGPMTANDTAINFRNGRRWVDKNDFAAASRE